MKTLEDYDAQREAFRLRMLQRNLEHAEKQGLAMQAAMSEHKVVAFIKRLPFEPTSYPAIECLKQSTIKSEDQDIISGEFDPQFEDHNFIEWCAPAHDHKKPERSGCGFIKSSSGKGIVYTSCPEDHEHHIKGKRIHCWSLRCPQCMNDTALKKGVKIERQLLLFKELNKKQGNNVGEIGHWVISPPQEFSKHMVQTYAEYDALSKYVDDTLMSIGASAGVTIFHLWRQKETEWEFAPHFHSLCYGRLNTNKFRKDNPGWIIKKIHSKEKIRSIRHTAAYLVTHMGLGQAERDINECDWDLKFLDYMIPGLKTKDADYNETDYENLSKNKGRMTGDISEIDWEKWTMKELTRELRIRYWGGVSRNNIRTLGTFRQYKIRVCNKCGTLLRTYDGFGDTIGSYVRYIQDNPVVAFSKDIERVKTIFLQFKARLREENLSIADFAQMMPFAISTLELNLDASNLHKDLVMNDPFEEPDEYFLRIQRDAFGE
jgi:hypothetical protein